MATSGTYLFSSPESREFIDDAFERIGFIPAQLDETKITSAQRSLNFILQSWPNRGLNLWLRRSAMMMMIPYQNQYQLPLYIIDILEGLNRQSVRNLNGTAFTSAGGIAANAFDGNPNTACTQNAPDGYISYAWTNPNYIITLVGVQSFVTRNYTLALEYSVDNINWITLSVLPEQSYPAGIIQWFTIQSPKYGTAFRIRETSGATLNISELYFNNNVNDTIMTRVSESEYMSYPYKSVPTSSQPTLYWVDRQINPVLYLWPTPSPQYNCFFFSYTEQIQDIGQMVNNPEVPARFLEVLAAELAFKLAQKYASDKVPYLEAQAAKEFSLAHEEDRERVPLRIFGDYMQGWSRS
jgi:hypothetical protein